YRYGYNRYLYVHFIILHIFTDINPSNHEYDWTDSKLKYRFSLDLFLYFFVLTFNDYCFSIVEYSRLYRNLDCKVFTPKVTLFTSLENVCLPNNNTLSYLYDSLVFQNR